jgi:isopenicillin N synthase-like dioxygenase
VRGANSMQPSRNTENTNLRGRFDAIPLVNVAGLAGERPERVRVAHELDRAARTAGFLYVSGHGVAPELLTALRTQTARFFALPESAKQAYYIGRSPNHRGYVPAGEEVFYGQSKDSKEAFDLSLDLPSDDPDFLAGNRLLGPNVWPRELPDFRAAVTAYYEAVLAFGKRLLAGFALALGLAEDHFVPQLQKPPSQLRLLHYPASADAGMGIGSHTDYECFTILHTTAAGLEVMNADGVWVDAPPIGDAFVVNIGDMLETMTHGTWVSTAHRVRRVQEQRYSFPLFFSLDYHAVVEPLPGFTPAGEAARYPKLVAGEHLLAQTAQTFRYFGPLIEQGRFRLPAGAKQLASFGRDRGESP